ncbi:iron-containing alcohol dehydrogenase family protein [Siccirubricoccus phaeus]|uniref:iron-containing alcohol dehydrogenase family protein n=1 Tax=Siccirubricoccus phaeus TaxID=2595053 RepID=UPI0011F1C0C2|nr:iron-containing alcohol dehydrogenase family protein [Siccirubricoccus phaeus]
MQSFRYLVPQLRLFQGAGCLAHLGRELARLGSHRAVIVCGSSVSSGPLVELAREALGPRFAGIYAGVRPHSPLPAVQEAAEALRRLDADAAVAIGGGSAIVTARAAAILLAENADVAALCTQPDATGELKSPKLAAPKIPQIVVPTTPTTAIPKAGSAILDPVANSRLALFDPKTRAQAIFLPPEAVESAPRPLFASAGVNTLTLAVEGLLSRLENPISDALLMHAVRLLKARLPDTMRSDDPAMRADLMAASILAGQGSDFTGAGLAIPLGHAIGARFHVDNGVTDAIVLPHVVRYNAPFARKGLRKLADAFQAPTTSEEELEAAVIAELGAISTALGFPRRLHDIGVGAECFDDLAKVTLQDWFVRNNPRPIADPAEVRNVLEEAW